VYWELIDALGQNRGEQGSTPSREVWQAASLLTRPWDVVKTKTVELLSRITGTPGGILLPGGGVILLDDRQFINDYLTLLTKGPGFQILGLKEEEYINYTRLALGPKTILCGGQDWINKTHPSLSGKGRVRRNTIVQYTRKSFLVKAMKKVLERKLKSTR